MKAPSRYEDSLKYCQDRFLVQSIQVDEDFDEKDITSNLFRSRDRQELKMKVVVVRTPSLNPLQLKYETAYQADSPLLLLPSVLVSSAESQGLKVRVLHPADSIISSRLHEFYVAEKHSP